MVQLKVIVNKLNKRSGPVAKFSNKDNIVGTVNENFTFESRGTIENELGIWHKDADGHFLWGGGVKEVVTFSTADTAPIFNFKLPADSPNKWWWDNLQIEKLWEKSKGENVVVAILDSGIDLTKSSLAPKVIKELSGNFVDFNGDIQDTYGHGTHCASIIGSLPANGFCGIAPLAKLVIAKVTTDNSGAVSLMFVRWAIEKLMLDKSIDIFSLSLGDAADESKLFSVIDEAISRYNKIFVCSVGNNYNSTPDFRVFYPAAYAEKLQIITTGALNKKFELSDVNYLSGYVTAFIPGEKIFGLTSSSNTGFNQYQSGTSQANAILAGIVSLIVSHTKKSDNPLILPPAIKKMIVNNLNYDTYTPKDFKYGKLTTDNLLNF